MGKWAARLAEKTVASPYEGTAETVKRGVPSVLAVPPQTARGESAPELPAVETPPPRFAERRARLIRWGWSGPDASALAERLQRRDLESDDRVSCADCRHHRPGRCGNHRCAGLGSRDIGRDWVERLQRCPGFRQEGESC